MMYLNEIKSLKTKVEIQINIGLYELSSTKDKISSL